jgi:hypothetical protein
MMTTNYARGLMNNVMERAKNKNFPGTRLLQASYHNRSLAPYASLGFEMRANLYDARKNQFKKLFLEELYVLQLSLMSSQVTLSAKLFMVITEMEN